MLRTLAYSCLLAVLLPAPLLAQQTMRFTIKNGELVNPPAAQNPATGETPASAENKTATFNQEQQWMFAALSAMVQRKYEEAEQLYSQIIDQNGAHAEAYLQRAVARRELKKTSDMTKDARMALSLLNGQLKAKPNDADLYYNRSMAERLLHEFDAAKKDLLTAMQLKGTSGVTYQNDLQAIELERKMAESVSEDQPQ